ncbi:MAG TPA: SRPBCC domain-containing protein [Nitrososphaerales archaeon]|nr:SRPBCC domain-containing protein [Nitrososphaerales archaeon]
MPSRKLAIQQEYYFEASPDTVFRALTEPKQLTRWFLSGAVIKPKSGSSFKFAWEGGYALAGKVKKVVPNRTLVLTWPDTQKGKLYVTQVAFNISKKGEGTMLKLKHTGFKEGDDWIWLFGAIQSGWAYFMTNLKSVLSQGKDLRSEFDTP